MVARITAICRLWHSDLIWGIVEKSDGRKRQGIVGVRWRPFKGEDESVVPLSELARNSVEAHVRQNPGFGEMPLFPAPRKASVPISRWTVRDWLLSAIELAEVKRPVGRLFHVYRHKWTTERKHHPIGDVAAASGRKDLRTVQNIYTHPDDETMRAVINEPLRLVSKGA